MNWAEIKKRWDERVVPNGWDKMGAEGARLYLEKYGRNISYEKLDALASYAYCQGNSVKFSLAIRKVMRGMISYEENENFKIFKREDVENDPTWNDDCFDYDPEGDEPIFFVEATAEELAKRKIGASCPGRDAFMKLAKKFPNIRIHASIDPYDNMTGSVDIFIDSFKQGERISNITGLRFDDGGPTSYPNWYYFENE